MFIAAQIRRNRSAAPLRTPDARTVCVLFAALLVGLSGCAVRDYSPPLLPTFMHEETPAGVVTVPDIAEGPKQRTEPTAVVCLTAPGASGTPISRFTPLVRQKEPAGSTEESEPEDKTKTKDEPFPPSKSEKMGLTLDEVVLECLRADPKLRAALEIITQAEADLLTSSLPPNPTFTPDGIFLPLRPFTPDKPGGPPQIDFTLGYPIDWFVFGKRAAAIESARLGVDVSAADYADQVRQRVANVVAAFYDVLEARALLDLARRDHESLKRVESITADRVKLGGVGTVEQDRIKLAVLDAQRELRSREVTYAAALSKLRSFLGPLGGDGALDVSGNLEVGRPAKPMSAAEVYKLAEETRPDIISLRRQITRAGAAIESEISKGYPVVTPTFALSRQFQSSIGSPDAPSYDVSLNVSLPLFDRNQGNIAKARSVEVQTALTLQSQLFDLRSEVAQAAEAFRAAIANVTANDPEQLKAAQNVRDKIEAGYKAGGRTLLEVIDAERAYRDTYRTYTLSQSNYWHSLHRLNAAIGKQVLR